MDTLEHVQDDVKAVREVARVLKPGGRFIFTVPLEGEGRRTVRDEQRYHKDDLVVNEYGGDLKNWLLDVGDFAWVQQTTDVNPFWVCRKGE